MERANSKYKESSLREGARGVVEYIGIPVVWRLDWDNWNSNGLNNSQGLDDGNGWNDSKDWSEWIFWVWNAMMEMNEV